MGTFQAVQVTPAGVLIMGAAAIGVLRTGLLAYFGLGLLGWWAYTLTPGWGSWGAYQAARALGLGLCAWASVQPVRLRVAR